MLDKIVTAYRKNVASIDLVKRMMKDTSTATHLAPAEKLQKIKQHQEVLNTLEGNGRSIMDMYNKFNNGNNMAHGGINGIKMAKLLCKTAAPRWKREWFGNMTLDGVRKLVGAGVVSLDKLEDDAKKIIDLRAASDIERAAKLKAYHAASGTPAQAEVLSNFNTAARKNFRLELASRFNKALKAPVRQVTDDFYTYK